MAKPRSETIGSYVRFGEVVRMDVDWRYPVTDPSMRSMRWTCSCGARGKWLREGPYRQASLPILWNEHVRRRHPDYEV